MLQKLYTENSNEKIRNKQHLFLLFHWLLFLKIGYFLQMTKVGIYENSQKLSHVSEMWKNLKKSFIRKELFHDKMLIDFSVYNYLYSVDCRQLMISANFRICINSLTDIHLILINRNLIISICYMFLLVFQSCITVSTCLPVVSFRFYLFTNRFTFQCLQKVYYFLVYIVNVKFILS